jgi:hypothetical protein
MFSEVQMAAVAHNVERFNAASNRRHLCSEEHVEHYSASHQYCQASRTCFPRTVQCEPHS